MRDYFDANDDRNFCSLAKEAKKYNSDNANGLRAHYEVKGMWEIIACYAIGYATSKLVQWVKAEPKFKRIVRDRNGSD